MKINFNFDGENFVAGVIAGLVAAGAVSQLWLLAVPCLLVGLEIKGMPYAKITYSSGGGWKVTKGVY